MSETGTVPHSMVQDRQELESENSRIIRRRFQFCK